jgi:Domain of unknown function (DUF4345)
LNFKNLHLITSTIIIIPVGLTYGLLPSGFFENMFQFDFGSTDLSGMFRAIMALYIAIGIFWLLGIYKSECWFSATISNVLIMSGLAFGRILSLFLDGTPSSIFLAGLIVEILLAAWGIFNLRQYK